MRCRWRWSTETRAACCGSRVKTTASTLLCRCGYSRRSKLGLGSIKCTDFRCIESAELEFSAGNNLVFGPNGSGKTSVLEAIAYLGRGRSFRGASTRQLIRHGKQEFVLFGRIESDGRNCTIGVRNSDAGLEVHTDGEKRGSSAALAEALPLQVIDPDVHKLIAGGPEDRRRFVDWIAFHVDHG
ncbi:MAG: DNA replication/repair protein RecF [Pseudomonadales bacterium]